MLGLLSIYHREDLARALERACRYRAFSWSAVERILAAQAKPRSAMEALAKVKDVEVLRPHLELFERLKTDRDGLVSYNAGIIVDKLAATLQATEGVGQEGQGEDE